MKDQASLFHQALEVTCSSETCRALQALILSERLQSISAAFDICRSQRYQQLMAQQQRQQKRQREMQEAKASCSTQNGSHHRVSHFTSSIRKLSSCRHRGWRARQQMDMDPGAAERLKPQVWCWSLDIERSPMAVGHFESCVASSEIIPDGAGTAGEMQAQQQIEAENQALQEELQSLGEQVAQTEASMRELAALNQMFSTQVLHQSEQTRQLYQQVCTEVLLDAAPVGTF